MTLLDRALDVNEALLALGCEVFETDGGRFVRDRGTPNIWDSNFVSHVTTSSPEEIERLLRRAEREFAEVDTISFHCDYRTPPRFEAVLALEGYEESGALVMLLEGDLLGEAQPFEIRLIDDEEGWRLYEELHRIDWGEYQEKLSDRDAEWPAREMMYARRSSSPPARFWLAYQDGAPRAYMTSWEGAEDVGQVEDLFTHPEVRHRGLATALIHHCVADARAHGAGPVVIVTDPDDTPKRMYAALGFRPLALKRTWRRKVASSEYRVASSQ